MDFSVVNSSPHFECINLVGSGEVSGEPANDGIVQVQLQGKHTQETDAKGKDEPDHSRHQERSEESSIT